MRTTLETQKRTREKINKAALKSFTRKGYEATTTRDIATAAGIAAGTLFNYFPSKEALAMSLIAEDLKAAEHEYERHGAARTHAALSMEESLFEYIATGFRYMRAHRSYAAEVFGSTLSLFSGASHCEEAERVRVAHLEAVRNMVLGHSTGATDDTVGNGSIEPSLVTMHLYWTLYLGVLAFWSSDESPHQEETLALLDRSVRLFFASLSSDRSPLEMTHDA